MCALIKGSKLRKFKIPEANKRLFDDKMKNQGFVRKVRQRREGDLSFVAAEGRCARVSQHPIKTPGPGPQ
jgi:hypothetical protein